MLKGLHIKNFTVFSDIKVPLCKGINVVVGSNGLGKSHFLKIGYTVSRWHRQMSMAKNGSSFVDKTTQQRELASKLISVFKPDALGRLTRRATGRQKAEVLVSFHNQPKAKTKFSFATNSSSEVTLMKQPEAFLDEESVFFPTKEMLSMFPGFAALYRDYSIEVDETYYDLCLALDRPLLKGPRFSAIQELLKPIEELLGGSVRNENGRFYLRKDGDNLEMTLVAEGFRKLASIAYLLANGTLAQQSILFWDEPETNLNPTYMRGLAKVLVEMSRKGTQVILATHSLFMLRELAMLLDEEGSTDVEREFIALDQSADGVVVSHSKSVEEIDPIATLDAEVKQSERYLEGN